MKAPIVQQFMTRLPHELEQIDDVASARRLMETYSIRHLPVMQGLHLRGIVSERDLLQTTAPKREVIDDMPIEKVLKSDVLTVGPLTPIDEVSRKMLDRKVGSAVVVDGQYVVGIFTTTDALKTLVHLFQQSG